ncbi:hypothetical protein WJX79_010706 [Trebouxia sp. C0005]
MQVIAALADVEPICTTGRVINVVGMDHNGEDHPCRESGVMGDTVLRMVPAFYYAQVLQDSMHIVLNQGKHGIEIGLGNRPSNGVLEHIESTGQFPDHPFTRAQGGWKHCSRPKPNLKVARERPRPWPTCTIAGSSYYDLRFLKMSTVYINDSMPLGTPQSSHIETEAASAAPC